MKNIIKRTFITIAALAVLFAVAKAQLAQSLEGGGNEPSPAGSWVTNITPDPTTGAPAEMNIASLTADGRFINVEANGHASVGEWRRTGPRGFGLTIQTLVIDNGQALRGKARGECMLSFRGDEFDCEFAGDYYDMAGNVVFSFQGTAHGNRFGVEPL